MPLLTLVLSASLFAPSNGFVAGDPPKGIDVKTAEDNHRKAKEAVDKADGGLKALSATLWAGSVLRGNPDLKQAATTIGEFGKPLGELKKGCDTLDALAARMTDMPALEKQSKSMLGQLKLVKLSAQKEELDRIGKMISAIPVGLVSDAVDPKFQVSGDLLVKNPREANARFKAYLAAINTNIDFLDTRRAQLEDASKTCKAAGTLLTSINAKLEKPAAGNKALLEKYLEIDALAKAYNSLAADAAAKKKELAQASEIERKRHKNLIDNIKLFFGFDS